MKVNENGVPSRTVARAACSKTTSWFGCILVFMSVQVCVCVCVWCEGGLSV